MRNPNGLQPGHAPDIVVADSIIGAPRMNPATIDLDVDRILAGLRPWVECESPTFDAAAIGRMMDIASRDLALLGASIERIPGRMGYGDCVRARFGHGGTQPGILVLAHLDTVHPIGTLKMLPWKREAGRVYGPGICDMKGGTYMAVAAVRALIQAGIATRLPVTILLTCDEEVGSPSTRDLIEAEAARNRFILLPEPGRPDNGVVTGRYAIARFRLETTGKPSHAGARLGEGCSAIAEMARQIIAIEAMTTPDCTFSVGVIDGGQWVNCVSTTCTAEALSMAKRQPDLDRGVAAMMGLKAKTNAQLSVVQTVTRPVWEPDSGTMALYTHARSLAQQIGFEIGHSSAAGGSDGNFTGAMGIPTLDGLGAVGDGYHTLGEYLREDSLVPRTRLLAGLLATLD